jgi:predicted ribosomally synthesized peptide with SipW-like signal peptide
MNLNLSRIALSLMLIVGAGGAIVNGTSAYFSDTETSTGNVFTAGDLDLKIANDSYYNGAANPGTTWASTDLLDHKFFDFDDLKPGDWGEDTITLHVNTNDAYMCANVTLTSNDDNSITEPEGLDDTSTSTPTGLGELADLVNFIWWADDGDNVLETDEEVISQGPIGALELNSTTTVVLADSDENIWDGSGAITGDTDYHIGKAWCFGTMTLTPQPQNDDNNPTINPGFTCDGSQLDNASQTDSLTADISFDAVQARNNPNFQCEVPETFDQCENPTLAFADTVVTSSQGVRKNGTPVLANRSVAGSVLGVNQSSGLATDPAVPAGSFFSLGFKNGGASDGGSIVVEFTDNVIVDGPGNDLKVWEVTGGTYPDEHVKIEVSQDGVTWFTVAADLTRDAEADIASSGLAWAKYIRLTDVTPIGAFEPEADAYDLDAFSALNCGVPSNGGPVISID